MSDTDKPAAPAAPKKKRSKLLMIGVPIFMLLSAGGGGGWWYMRGLKAAAAAEVPAEPAEPSGLLVFEPFTVNLADPGGRRYLRLALHLVLPDADAAKHASEEELVMARIRSALLEVLSSKLATDLATPAGRADLKKTIAETATTVGHLEVHDVLFQEFVVQ